MTEPVEQAELVRIVESIPEYIEPAEPSWDRARELCGKVRASVADIVALGAEIEALRKQWFDVGHGGDRRSASYQKIKRDTPVTLDPRTDAHSRKVGWQNKVEQELGMSYRTALRAIDRAIYTGMLREICAGEEVQWLDSKHETKQITPTPEMRQLAAHALEEVVSGTANPVRAWAGVVGESHRRKSGGTAARAAVDHYKNLKGAIASLKTSLKHWKHLEPNQRAEIEFLWQAVAKSIPETWK